MKTVEEHNEQTIKDRERAKYEERRTGVVCTTCQEDGQEAELLWSENLTDNSARFSTRYPAFCEKCGLCDYLEMPYGLWWTRRHLS